MKRATAAGGPFSAVGSPTVTSFTDTTALDGTSEGEGEGAAALTISTTPSIVVDNASPSGVTITGTWTASTAVAGY